MTAPSGPGSGARRRIVTPWRLLYAAALGLAVILAVVGFQASKDENRTTTCASAPIVQLVPCPGDTDLRQGLIGVSLQAGLRGALIVDSTEIPDDQLRTGGPNQFFFQPGPGTETGALAPGLHSATVVYWPLTGTRETDGKSFTWHFGVT
jgi:hypothetical protein